MRDHRKLKAFGMTDQLVVDIYRETRGFPVEERFGLAQQMRRAAVSIPSNIVEGCARRSRTEYLRYLDIAFASARELGYQLSLAGRLGFLKNDRRSALSNDCDQVTRTFSGLIQGIRNTN